MINAATDTQLGYEPPAVIRHSPYPQNPQTAGSSLPSLLPIDSSMSFGSPLLGHHGMPTSHQRMGSVVLDKRLHEAYLFAFNAYDGLDKERLARACREARLLASCALFQETLFPEVSIDPNGEITLSCRARGGYVDIGVCGDQELSFHVRNDVEPRLSAYADMEWTDYKIPSVLLDALEALQA